MQREKMAGANLREGNVEVALELWIEWDFIFLVGSNGGFRR